MHNLPTRKPNRLKNFDYSECNVYLLTICTQAHKCLFGYVRITDDEPVMELNPLGRLVAQAIAGIEAHYKNVFLDAACVMPNHVHLLLRLESSDDPHRPTVSRIVKQMKEYVTKQSGKAIWQKSFHDEIVRNDYAYQAAWNYVTYNAAKWAQDPYYSEE